MPARPVCKANTPDSAAPGSTPHPVAQAVRTQAAKVAAGVDIRIGSAAVLGGTGQMAVGRAAVEGK